MKRMKFKGDAPVFFTADHHFGHSKIIEYEDRPVDDTASMEALMIERWNGRVQPGDTVFHLGDFAFSGKRKEVEALLAKLNGTKYLIVGNHDSSKTRNATGWADVVWYQELTVGNQPIVLSHYAFHVWNGHHHEPGGSWNLHGHSHGNLTIDWTKRRCDVGVDCWDFWPVGMEELRQYMAKVRPKAVDHHRVGGR
jgi:calcineurin-like phosphoesterase family protein